MHETEKKEKNGIGLIELFLILFKINLITFGGGYTIIPIIREAFVLKRKIISDKEMLDVIALSESTPGAMAISCSYLVGLRIRGKSGGAAAVLGAVLPPLIVVSLVYYFYTFVAANIYIRAALRGMSGVIVAMLVMTSKDLFLSALKSHPVFSLLIMIPAAVLSFFNIVSTALLICVIAVIGIVTYLLYYQKREEGKTDARE